jgi:hypothetical protein
MTGLGARDLGLNACRAHKGLGPGDQLLQFGEHAGLGNDGRDGIQQLYALLLEQNRACGFNRRSLQQEKDNHTHYCQGSHDFTPFCSHIHVAHASRFPFDT